MHKHEIIKSGEGACTPRIVKAQTLAQLLDCSVRQVAYWAERGILLPIKLGDRCVRYDVAESLERLKAHGKGAI